MTSIAATLQRYQVQFNLYKAARRNFEWIVAFTVLLLVGWQYDFISTRFAGEQWGIDRFYSAVFSWASIQSAFLFSVFAFFLSRSEPFIQAIAQTEPFRALRSYVLRALWLSLGLTLLSLPLLVAAPAIVRSDSLTIGFGIFWFVTVWLAYTFMCFVKVIRVFRKLEGMQD